MTIMMDWQNRPLAYPAFVCVIGEDLRKTGVFSRSVGYQSTYRFAIVKY